MKWKPLAGSILAFLAGTALFLYFFLKQNPADVFRLLFRRIGLNSVVILVLLRLAYWIWRTWCWKIVLSPLSREKPRFLDLLANRLAGFAVGTFIPGGKVLAEPARIACFRGVSRRGFAASVVLDKILEWTATAVMIIVALVLLSIREGLSSIVRNTSFALAAALFLVLISGFLWLKCSGPDSMLRRIQRIFNEKSRIWRAVDFLRRTDEDFRRLLREKRSRLVLVFFLYMGLTAWWSLEIFFTLRILGAEAGFMTAFLIVTLGSLAFILPAAPGNIGLYEGTYAVLFALLAVPGPPAIASIFARRGLSLLFGGMGGLFFFRIFGLRAKQAYDMQGDSGQRDDGNNY